MTFLGLLAHLIGDYVLQNHMMANKKTIPTAEGWRWATLHAVLYSIPFLCFVPLLGTLIIGGTHLIIDHYRLASYWCEFWGIGCTGTLSTRLLLEENEHPEKLEDGAIAAVRYADGHVHKRLIGVLPAPPYLRAWLGILVDNIAHICINTAVIAYYYGL